MRKAVAGCRLLRLCGWQAHTAATLLLAGIGSRGFAQVSGLLVRVQVVDSATGRPLTNVWMGAALTDTTGSFRFRVPPGSSQTFEFTCPTTRLSLPHRARLIASRIVRVDSDADTSQTVALALDPVACAEPLLRTRTGTFRGHYSRGFENNFFTPCVAFDDLSHTAYAPLPSLAWVTSDSATWARELQARTAGESRDPTQQTWTYYVRWSGTLTGPGVYGHMGLGTYQFVLNHVAVLRAPRRDDCGQ